MMRSANPLGWLAIGFMLQLMLCAVLLCAAWAAVPTPTRAMSEAALPAEGTPGFARLMDAGRRIAVAECLACHSAKPERPFAGGVPLDTPFGRIHSTNISPDAVAGIGRHTLDDFDRAVRHGIARDGRTLDPVMPYAAYARLSDADTQALHVFLRHGVAAAPDVDRPIDTAWPASMRSLSLTIRRKVVAAPPDAGPASTAAADTGRQDAGPPTFRH